MDELQHLQLGQALRQALCRTWVETLVALAAPLHIYLDADLKPYWTHLFKACGDLPLLDQVTPSTRQVTPALASGASVVTDAKG